MKLHLKISILLSAIFGVLILLLLAYLYIRNEEKEVFYRANEKNQELVIDKVLQLNRIKYEQLINDNSAWDEMASFVAKPDTLWPKTMLIFLFIRLNYRLW